MSRDLNKTTIIGRLGKDPETKYTSGGNARTVFSVACGRQWKDANGEQQEHTEWFNVVAWGKLAEIAGQYLAKGRRVYVEGRMETRSWDDQASGTKRYMTELIASDIIMLDSQREAQPQAAAPAQTGDAWDDEPLPF